MKSFNTQKSYNDENINIKSKTSTSKAIYAEHDLRAKRRSSIDSNNIEKPNSYNARVSGSNFEKREVLGDLTQFNENRKVDLTLRNSIQKVQVFKQKQIQKQQIERLERKSRFESKSIDTHVSDDSVRVRYDHLEEDQALLKSDTVDVHKDSRTSKSYTPRDSIEGVTSNNHFEERFSSSSDHRDNAASANLYNNTTENYSMDVYDNRSTDDEENVEELEEDESIKPMEPKWNKEIFSELQYVMKKHAHNALDEDDEDTYDVTMVTEYSPEIFNYMHELEYKLVPDPFYMEQQDELKWEMRAVLIDWVVQVHNRFNLFPETLFLTINCIDRFLSKRKVSLSRFQLVGAVALFIAAKYEEINCPTVQEVAYMADNAYSIEDFLKAERFMIDVLEFEMGWPGPMSFLRRTSKADDYDYETRTLAKYFLEITIMDYRFVASQPSWLAAGAHYVARKLLNKGGWTESHVFYSGYTERQLRPLAEVLLKNCREAEKNHKAIFEKYKERRYRRSSLFVQEYFKALEL